jgi:hypothetical protein
VGGALLGADLPKIIMQQIEHLFTNYNDVLWCTGPGAAPHHHSIDRSFSADVLRSVEQVPAYGNRIACADCYFLGACHLG